jgi:hypothetical protein
VLAMVCALLAALAAAAPASAGHNERRVFFTIKSVSGSSTSSFNVPRGVSRNDSGVNGCPTAYLSGSGREDIAFRSKRSARATAVWETHDRQPHWRMNRVPYSIPIEQTISREAVITYEPVRPPGCNLETYTEVRPCGGPEVYRIDDASLFGVTVGPHNRRPYNSFSVENWQGATDYLRPEHPLADCQVYNASTGNIRIENGMWRIVRGRWKRKTIRFDRTWTAEVCLGRTYLYDPPEPPCGPVTTRIAWTVKLVRRPDPRKR